MLRNKSLLFTVLILFGGCATNSPDLTNNVDYEVVMAQYRQATNCCQSVEQFNIVEMPIQATWNFEISNKDQAFQFKTGLSYFKGIKLPDLKESKVMRILSYDIRDKGFWCNNDCSYEFHHYVLFLDENKKPLGLLTPDKLNMRIASMVPMESGGMEYAFKLTPMDKARYVVVFTTPEDIKNGFTVSYGRKPTMYSPDGKTIMPMDSGGTTSFKMRSSPFGKFKVTLESKDET